MTRSTKAAVRNSFSPSRITRLGLIRLSVASSELSRGTTGYKKRSRFRCQLVSPGVLTQKFSTYLLTRGNAATPHRYDFSSAESAAAFMEFLRAPADLGHRSMPCPTKSVLSKCAIRGGAPASAVLARACVFCTKHYGHVMAFLVQCLSPE